MRNFKRIPNNFHVLFCVITFNAVLNRDLFGHTNTAKESDAYMSISSLTNNSAVKFLIDVLTCCPILVHEIRKCRATSP